MMSPVWQAGICCRCSVGVRRLHPGWQMFYISSSKLAMSEQRSHSEERLLKRGFEAKLKSERVALISHPCYWLGGKIFCVRLSRSLEIVTGDTLKRFVDCRNFKLEQFCTVGKTRISQLLSFNLDFELSSGVIVSGLVLTIGFVTTNFS